MFVTGHAVINLLYFKLSPVALIVNPLILGESNARAGRKWGRRVDIQTMLQFHIPLSSSCQLCVLIPWYEV